MRNYYRYNASLGYIGGKGGNLCYSLPLTKREKINLGTGAQLEQSFGP
jgi:hypothetical protein